MKRPERHSEPKEALYRIQRALAGTVSYLAACDTNVTFSEYILYEPILRILMTCGYAVQCEFPCPGIPRHVRGGDHKRVDFEAKSPEAHFVLEVKWPKKITTTLDVKRDHQKLLAFREANPEAFSFICVFGRYNHISKVRLSPNSFSEPLEPVFALFGRTQFGCRIFELDSEPLSFGQHVHPP